MQRQAALLLLVSQGMCTCPMSIEDSARADARRQMLGHTLRDISGSLRATWPAFSMIVMHPNKWVCGCVQQAQSGCRNTVTSGKQGLGDKPVVQAGQRLVSLGPRDVSEGPDMPLGLWNVGNAFKRRVWMTRHVVTCAGSTHDRRDTKCAILVISDGLKVVGGWPGMSGNAP